MLPVGRADDFQNPFDLLIIFTKGFHTSAAIESVKHLVGPNTWAMSVQNGWETLSESLQSYQMSASLSV